MNDKKPASVVSITTSSNSNTPQKKSGPIAFNRFELDAILRIYGIMVATSQWKDYAIDHLDDRAIFSIFRKAHETPLFRIEKNPKLTNRQGAYSVIATNGMVLKRGQDLRQVLRIFDKYLIKLL